MSSRETEPNIKRGLSIPETRRTIGLVDNSFYIIGVGASAGGLEAIRQLVGQADREFPHTFVIIQHLSPERDSLMVEILSRETELPVEEVKDDALLEPGKIYLTPPRSNVVIQGTIDDTQPENSSTSSIITNGLRFSLVAAQPRPQLNLSIDLFFHSLAEAVGDRAIGVVLSGTGTDGSRGIRAIKDRDGFVVVQEPETAEFDGMPQAALKTKIVDLVTPPDAVISELKRYIQVREDGVFDIDGLFRNHESSYKSLIKRVSESASIDFSLYKPPTLKRRIARRIGLTNSGDVPNYLTYVQKNPEEIEVLHREFLIGVTNFFRDLPAWIALRKKIIPELFKHGEQSESIKIWSVGCSTGEEAYSLALLLENYRLENSIQRDFRIFASDVNKDAIASAKDGIFPASLLEEIPEEYRNDRNVIYQGGTFKIGASVKNKIIFREHNVLEDVPFINTDMIVCRNFLIYLGSEMQSKALSLFAFSLRKDGYLFLGAAENMSHRTAQFKDEIASLRIFKNQSNSRQSKVSDDFRYKPLSPLPRLKRLAARDIERTETTVNSTLTSLLRISNAGIFVIDEAGTILETYGSYQDFVSLPRKAFSANIFDLVHDRLKSSLSLLLRQAEVENKSDASQVRCSLEDRIEELDIFVEKNTLTSSINTYTLILRKSRELPLVNETGETTVKHSADGTLVTKLESEVEALREMLKLTSEDLGISNEELQTANEELTVSNEELQANNEEMQSINEELHTVNSENAEKILLLEEANADIDDLLDTADLAIILLERDLTIRRFNKAFGRYFDLKPTDLGRKLSSFAASFKQQGGVTLLEEAQKRLNDGAEKQLELELEDNKWTKVRIRPLRSSESESCTGLAISILDVSKL